MIRRFEATPSIVRLGQSILFRWEATNVATGIEITPINYTSDKAVDTYTYTPDKTNTYRLVAFASPSNTVSEPRVVRVVEDLCTSAPVPLRVAWRGSSANCSSSGTSGCGSGESIAFEVTGALALEPTCPYEYRWTFGDGSPESTEQNPTHPFNVGCHTYQARVEAKNTYGSVSATTDVSLDRCGVAAIDDFRASQTRVRAGEAVTLTWRAREIAEFAIQPIGVHTRQLDGQYSFVPTKTMTVQLVPLNGEVPSRSITIEVEGAKRRAVAH